jgi:hypothetical protein
MNARKAASIVCLVACALAVVLVAGCGSAKPKTQGLPIQKSTSLPSGTMPGVEFVGEATVPMGERANIDGWQATGALVDSAPTLKAGSYKPIADSGDLAVVSVQTGTSNGIAQKVIVFTFTPAGAKKLANYATTHPDDSIAIVLKRKVIVMQDVSAGISNGVITVSGDPRVAAVLEAAVTPAP